MTAHVAIVYSGEYRVDLGGVEQLHAFDVNKYARIYEQLEADGLLAGRPAVAPEPVSDDDLRLVHSDVLLRSLDSSRHIAEYLEAPVLAMLPVSVLRDTILRSFRWATGGTILAGRLALGCGIAVNLGGGYHHAKPHRGEGFSIFNDIAVAVRRLRADGLFRRVLVVDLDVHQGNGTAVVFDGDDEVYTFSMHESDIYPVPKELSDLDVELPPGTGDEVYMAKLRETLPEVFEASRPEIVFLVAGCDTLEGDPLARLRMTEAGIVKRDAMVIDACVRRDIPVVMTLGGGYSADAWSAQYASVARTIRTYGLAPGVTPDEPR